MFRRLLFTTLVVGLSVPVTLALLWAIEGTPAAVGQDNKNCPSGFNWIRMSGQCCVQDPGTIPANGKIGYTGNSLCVEGYSGVYEQRPTTDGKGPPGCPGDTSFPFLKECVKGDGAAAGAGALGGDGVIRDASEALYGGGGGPSKKDLAAAGGAIAATMVTAAAGSTLTRGPRLGRGAASSRIKELTDRLAQLDRPLSDALQALEKAHEDRESLWQERKVLKAMADAAQSQQMRLNGIMARIEAYRGSLGTSRWFFGLSATLMGLAAVLAAPAIIAQVGFLARVGQEVLAMQVAAQAAKLTILRFIHSAMSAGAAAMKTVELEMWKELKDSFAEAKTRTAYFQGKVRGELERIPREYEEANRRLDAADARVRQIRSERMRVYQQLQQARKGR